MCDDKNNDMRDTCFQSKDIVLKTGISITIHAFQDFEENCISVYAEQDGVVVAEGKFDPQRSYFRGIEVIPNLRRNGIATCIYDYVGDLGFSICPSNNVQPDGQKFWQNYSYTESSHIDHKF